MTTRQPSSPARQRPRLGFASAMVLLNGIVLAALAFYMIRLTVDDIKMVEAVALSKDMLRQTEEAVKEAERTATTLAAIYNSVEVGSVRREDATQQVIRTLAPYGPSSVVLWVTEKGDRLVQRGNGTLAQGADVTDAAIPTFEQISRAMDEGDHSKLRYIHQAAWQDITGRRDTLKGGVIVRSRLNDGSDAYAALLLPPSRIFGQSWQGRYADVARVTITEKDTGRVVHDESDPNRTASEILMGTSPVKNVLRLGDGYYDIVFRMRPSYVSPLMSLAPFGAGALVLALSVLTSVILQRRDQQDIQLAEMTETLQGASEELQSKTSERDQLLLALRKSEREYKAVINSVSDVIFETDETGRILFLNETWRRMLQRDKEEAIGKSLFDFLDKTDQLAQRDRFDQLVRGERQAYREETGIDGGNGIIKPVEIAFSMLRVSEDKKVRVVGTITDIEKRRRAEMAVRAAEQQFRSIFENALSGIYQTSPDGRFLNANPALAEILGYASAEELIVGVSDISRDIYINPADRQHFISKLLFEGRISGYESQIRRKDGKVIWILENARVVRSEKGSVAYFEGSVSDITEQKISQEEVRQARIQAEISSRSRMEFLANMSHELRTPLNAIIGFSEIIKEEILGPVGIKEYKEYAQDIYDSGNGLLRVISEILEVSKIATGNRELNVSNFRLSRAVKSCMIILGSRIQQSGVEVKVNLPDDLPELLGEELGMKQVLLNLIGNAIKFTKHGGKVDVTARVEPTGEMIIDVVDTGIGMTPDEVRRAMEPFAKVDMSFGGMKEGTGLGLTIADSIVKLHGAELQLISEKGHGTTARVIMPAFRVLTENTVAGASHLKVIK